MDAVPQSRENDAQWSFDSAGGKGAHEELKTLVAPTHPDAYKLLAFWKARPSDGLVIGRDVPSRRIAPLLSNIMVSEPVDGGRDFLVHLAGDGTRHRFGAVAKDVKLSQLVPPEQLLRHAAIVRRALETDEPDISVARQYSGAVELTHMEVVILPVWAPGRSGKWVLAGIFYFR